MKCPKCGYLGFEAVDRCRNCGYDFSLTAPVPAPDLSLRGAAGDGARPLDDLNLTAQDQRGSADTLRAGALPRPAASREPAAELPLFGTPPVDERSPVARVSPPRSPLAVRRATPDLPRRRGDGRPSLLDHPADVDEPPLLWRPLPPTSREQAAVPVASVAASLEDASLAARASAGLIDLLVLLAVDGLVIYFTLQINGLTFDEFGLLPLPPLLAFLTIQDLGYFAAFTAGGQTLGKMVTGIQVVAEGSHRAPAFSQALLRTTLWLLLVLPAGLGLASVLLDSEKRGLHDRFARTRVVRTAP